MRYLFTDAETGGLDPARNPLLTAYFLVLDRDFNEVGELRLRVRPEDWEVCDERALEVTGINLEAHCAHPETVSRAEAAAKLKAWLEEMAERDEKGRPKKRSLKAAGHNHQFDRDFYLAKLLTREEWEAYVHYGYLDTKILGDLLKDAGWLPEDLGTLQSYVAYLGVPQRKAHDDREDVLMTVDVYRAMVAMLAERKEGGGGGMAERLSLLEAL